MAFLFLLPLLTVIATQMTITVNPSIPLIKVYIKFLLTQLIPAFKLVVLFSIIIYENKLLCLTAICAVLLFI